MSIHTYDNTRLVNANGSLGWTAPLTIAVRWKHISAIDATQCIWGLTQTVSIGLLFMYSAVNVFMRDAENVNSGGESLTGATRSTTEFLPAILRLHNDTTYSVDIDGVNYKDNAINVVSVDYGTTTFNEWAIGGRQGADQDIEAKFSDVAVWNIALTDDQVRSYTNGCSPLMISPGNLLSFAPGINSELRDLVLPTNFAETAGVAATLDTSDNPKMIFAE